MSFYKNLTGGNPFSTKVGLLVEQCTDGNQASENWGVLMETCDTINETDEGPKDAIKAIKKRFSSSGKNYKVVMYTLTLLETCVKNCGRRFHVQVAHKDFLQEMIKTIGPKNDPPQVVQEKVLSMIQTWADAFQGQPDMKEVCKVYQELKNKGIDFPMTDLDSMAPIHTPARTASEISRGPPQQRQQSVRAPGAVPQQRQPAPMMMPPQYQTQQVPQYPAQQVPQQQQPQQQQQIPPAGPVVLGPEQMGKLKSELEVVQQNTRVFSEMLTELTPGEETPSDLELLTELNGTCKQMQRRMLELIEGVQNEEVTCELLHVNDELNNVFLRYERYERLRAGQARKTTPDTVTEASQAPPSYNQANTPLPPIGIQQQQPAAPTGTEPAGTGTANLIDFGDTPSPQPQNSSPFTGQNNLNDRLAGLSMGSNITPSNLDQLTSRTAMSGSHPQQQPPPTGGSDDFDMFAQSRQSFEQSKQQLPGQGWVCNGSSTYNAQQSDQFEGGLGSAMNAKTSNPFSAKDTSELPEVPDKDTDIAEMEEWLKQNPQSQNQPESATSSEFDRFLQDRAQDSSSNRGGRQMQKDNQDDAMFAL